MRFNRFRCTPPYPPSKDPVDVEYRWPDPNRRTCRVSSDIVAHSHEVLGVHARSFSWAAAFLPSHAADDAAVVYAMCRLIDDLVDENPSLEGARRDVTALIDELEGRAEPRPLVVSYLEIAHRTGMGLQPVHALIEGVLDDLREVRMADDRALIRYCYHVASTVGLMMCAVLGVRDPTAWPYAVDLGVAMQLTNICRDVKEDANNGRVYLPATRLAAQGLTPTQLVDAQVPGGAVVPIVDDLILLSERYYRSANHGMHHIPARTRVAIHVASRVYRAIGKRLRRHGSDPMVGRTIVPWFEKVFWVAVGLLDAAKSPFTRMPHECDLHQHIDDLPGTHRPA